MIVFARFAKVICGLLVAVALMLCGFDMGQRNGSRSGFFTGYKAAYEDYREGNIECVVKVKHPEWLEQGK